MQKKKKKNSCSFLPPTPRSKLPLWVWRGWEITTYIITICRILVRIIRKHLCFSASWSKAKYSQLRHFKRVQMLLIKNKHKDFPQDYSYNCHFLLRKKFFFVLLINKVFLGITRSSQFLTPYRVTQPRAVLAVGRDVRATCCFADAEGTRWLQVCLRLEHGNHFKKRIRWWYWCTSRSWYLQGFSSLKLMTVMGVSWMERSDPNLTSLKG